MLIDLLANRLAENDLGVLGVSIFTHHIPAEVKVGILLKIPLDGIQIDPYLPDYYKTEVQIIIRHNVTALGEELASKVEKLFHSHNRYEYLENNRTKYIVNQMFALTKPIRYPLSDGNLVEWSLNFMVNFVEK
jgi:hypothetical protein